MITGTMIINQGREFVAASPCRRGFPAVHVSAAFLTYMCLDTYVSIRTEGSSYTEVYAEVMGIGIEKLTVENKLNGSFCDPRESFFRSAPIALPSMPIVFDSIGSLFDPHESFFRSIRRGNGSAGGAKLCRGETKGQDASQREACTLRRNA